ALVVITLDVQLLHHHAGGLLSRVARREDDLRQVVAGLTDPPNQLLAGHVRHEIVDDDELDALPLEDLQRRRAAHRSEDGVPFLLQEPACRLQDLGAVIHHEDAASRPSAALVLPSHDQFSATGIWTANVVPAPTSVWKSMVPEKFVVTMLWASESPRPVPRPMSLVVNM